MNDYPSLEDLWQGLKRRAQERRAEEAANAVLFGYPRRVQSVPASEAPDDLRAELDALGAELVAASPKGPPRSEEQKAKLRIK